MTPGSEMSSEKGYLVVTAVGPDRAGIVSDLSGLIHRAHANLEDSRMAVLGGEFALLLLVSGEKRALSGLHEQLKQQESSLGLHLMCKFTSGPRMLSNVLPYSIRVSGFDRPGIVQSVTGVLARRGINVSALESRVSNAPLSGTPLFVLEAELEIPSEVALSELRRELASKCDEENLDVTLEARG
ncbi:MAG: ACT domain-containing protein [Polyangiaceae bacterium]